MGTVVSPNRTIEKEKKNVYVAADGNGHNSMRIDLDV